MSGHMRGLLKGLLKRTLARFGFYLGRFPDANTLDAHLLHLFARRGINCILDVGAHHGEYSLHVRDLGYRGRIVSFEPVAENFAVLNRERKGDRQWQAYPFALGAEDSEVTIKIMNGSTFSSFLAPSDYGLKQFGTKLDIRRHEVVQIRRLDGVLDRCLEGIDSPRVLLKIDTQGYDLRVIEGAGRKLDQIIALQTEISVKPIYEGEDTSLSETVFVLQKHGFDLIGFFPVSWDRDDPLRVIEFDCLACRPAPVSSEQGFLPCKETPARKEESRIDKQPQVIER